MANKFEILFTTMNSTLLKKYFALLPINFWMMKIIHPKFQNMNLMRKMAFVTNFTSASLC